MTAHHPMPQRTAFFISDGTGITTETIGHSVLAQFEGLDYHAHRIPFVDTADKAANTAEQIAQHQRTSGKKAIVFTSLVDHHANVMIAETGALIMDVLTPFAFPLERELGVKRRPRVGGAHALVDYKAYEDRINATHFALTHDDGKDFDYNEADLILVAYRGRAKPRLACIWLSIMASRPPITR